MQDILTRPARPQPGMVWLIGAGPGAIDLITVRGATLLQQAEVVLYDALVTPEILQLCSQALLVSVGKRSGQRSTAQTVINEQLIACAQRFERVVRLKGGDPMLFGRADEEIRALKDAGIEIEVVPGITAALAGAASIQQSLTLRGVSRSVAFITLAQAESTEKSTSNQPISNPSADTLVYYMGRKDATKIAKQLIERSLQGDIHHETTPVQILEAVSTARERLWSSTLTELANGKADEWFDSSSPALIMVGEALRESEGSSSEIDNRLQDSQILTNGRRCA